MFGVGISSGESDDDSSFNDSSNQLDRLKQIKQRDVVSEFRQEHNDMSGPCKRTLQANDPSGSDSDEGVAAKRTMLDGPGASGDKQTSFAERMMKKMGYKDGSGLGKNAQGISQPIQLSTQRGRTGIGHESGKVLGRDLNVDWDDTNEKKTVEETPIWLPVMDDLDADEDDEIYLEREKEVNRVIDGTVKIAKRKMTIDDEIDVVDKNVLARLLDAKTVFDDLNDRELRDARTRANPYETIASGIFQNRAAMKAANMDGVFDFCFSQEEMSVLEDKCPLDISKTGTNKFHRDKELFYFADVCAGPGGFSEYTLWRKGFYNAKGFGFTLKGKDDFKLTKFLASSPLYFEPYYGKHDDGDVTKPENIDSFEEVVYRGTGGQGVHLMMADGGFCVEGQENIQEILSKRIYLCQLLVSLCIVREGGNFYCKLFDIFTRFSYELVFLMRLCYKEVCIHKPHTSRPANSERYIICKGLMKRFSDPIRDYLKAANRKMEELKEVESSDVMSLIPNHFGDALTDCESSFLEYLTDSNNNIGRRQTHYLKKYLAYAKNNGLIDKDQADLREKCMAYWRVPYDMQPSAMRDRRRPFMNNRREQLSPEMFLGKFAPRMYGDTELGSRSLSFEKHWRDIMINNRKPKQLTCEEYRCVWATQSNPRNQCKLLVSTSECVFVYNNQWEREDHFNMRVPADTILLVEFTKDFVVDNGKLKKNRSISDTIIRVLDAAVLSGDNISELEYGNRMKCVKKFCEAVNLAENTVYVAIPIQEDQNNRRGRGGRQNNFNRPRFERRSFTPKVLVPVEYFEFRDLERNKPRLEEFERVHTAVFEEAGRTFLCQGLYLFKYINDNWAMFFSRSNRKSYAYNPKAKNQSVFPQQFEEEGCVTSFWDTGVLKKTSNRMFWNWSNRFDNTDYGARSILSDDSNASGPTVPEVEKAIGEMYDATA